MRSFPAKVLLFGEHTVLYGGRALAVPFGRFSAKWVNEAIADERLLEFGDYLRKSKKTTWLYIDKLLEDLKAGWQLSSSVPVGYGLGSSGTVCAALYARYAAGGAVDLTTLRERLATMESFFHGSSSGLDPLVSLQNSPVLVSPHGSQKVDVAHTTLSPIFLLDSGQARSSANIIPTLRQRFEVDKSWQKLARAEWMAPTETLIQAMTSGAPTDAIAEAMRRLSRFQFDHLGHLIPEAFHRFANRSDFCLKLCGAGGGGFLIGYTFDRESTIKALAAFQIFWLTEQE
ncbi:MAG: hypothetical protein AAF741_00140 [Bacteroidota bacterium]